MADYSPGSEVFQKQFSRRVTKKAIMNKCRICDNSSTNKVHVAREMMFGYRDEFEYFECSNCGCLQIREIPGDLTRYYPESYYPVALPSLPKFFLVTSFFRRQRLLRALGEENFLGLLLSKLFRVPRLPQWVSFVKLHPDSSILDVGCGVGGTLMGLRKKGFTNLTGVDLFIKDDVLYKCGVRVFKKEIADVEGEFDFIMLQHSFEHMADPLSVLKKAYCLLKSDRYVLIRIPVGSSFAWEKYKINWVQLDAPRHLFLHSTKSMQILVGQAGFRIENIVFDSGSLQFWASEQYARDIPLRDRRSYLMNPESSMFSAEDIQRFEEKAKELNRNKKGDQACFYLYKE